MPGATFAGPAVVVQMDSTTAVPPGWRAEVDASGNLVLETRLMPPDARIDPAELSIAAALFSSVAEEMGVTLGRSAHSPNIKERRDYSCAVFDREGRLVAQAAHIPVHLGAMPTAVEAAMPLAPFAPGDIVILNDPYLGGTHLPDIT